MTIDVRRSDAAPGLGKRREAIPPVRGNLVLVDTDANVASRLMEDAAAIGIGTTWYTDGAEALLAVGAERPDVLVLAARTDTRLTRAKHYGCVSSRWNLPVLVGSLSIDDEMARRSIASRGPLR